LRGKKLFCRHAIFCFHARSVALKTLWELNLPTLGTRGIVVVSWRSRFGRKERHRIGEIGSPRRKWVKFFKHRRGGTKPATYHEIDPLLCLRVFVKRFVIDRERIHDQRAAIRGKITRAIRAGWRHYHGRRNGRDDEIPRGNQPRRVDRERGRIAAVAIQVADVAREADRVFGEPATDGRIIPPIEVVLQPGFRVKRPGRVQKQALDARGRVGDDVAESVVNDVLDNGYGVIRQRRGALIVVRRRVAGRSTQRHDDARSRRWIPVSTQPSEVVIEDRKKGKGGRGGIEWVLGLSDVSVTQCRGVASSCLGVLALKSRGEVGAKRKTRSGNPDRVFV